jgi:hypothetical protein
LTLALAFTWTVPARAAELALAKPTQAVSLAAATSARLARLDANEALRATQSATPAAASSDSPSFFKSPKGIAVILLMAVGTGYAIYSAKSERIDNPLR